MRNFKINTLIVIVVSLFLVSCNQQSQIKKVWLIGDSTVANYALENDYMTRRHPITGWGQVFQQFWAKDSLEKVANLISADSIVVDDRAKGGRSTRTFFQEGRWRYVYENMQRGDLVLIQFGHNDAAETKQERYVNIEGYKEFLRLYVLQARQKGGKPVFVTPVARNYPWVDGHLENVHGDYPQAMKSVAAEMDVLLIDLNQLSMDAFSKKGKEYVSRNYFMNLPAAKYVAYPDGQDDNTHFQPEGAEAVARLVFEDLKRINDEI